MIFLRDILDELRLVLFTKALLVDSILPSLLFLIINAVWGLWYAVGFSICISLLLAFVRIVHKQSLLYVTLGVTGVLLAALLANLLGRAQGYFLPGMIQNSITVLLCFGSVLAKRPLVAFTSFFARRWPLRWYWHERVQPAYREVTLVWGVFFAVKLWLQIMLFYGQSGELFGFINTLLGWPATMVLLIVSYVYGIRRLQKLQGPSVEEFKQDKPEPWEGQKKGF